MVLTVRLGTAAATVLATAGRVALYLAAMAMVRLVWSRRRT